MNHETKVNEIIIIRGNIYLTQCRGGVTSLIWCILSLMPVQDLLLRFDD